jgi:hypothetical protein
VVRLVIAANAGACLRCRRCVQTHLRDPACSFPARAAFFPDALVRVRLPLSPKSGFGMKVTVLPCRRDVLDDVLVHHHFVGRAHE